MRQAALTEVTRNARGISRALAASLVLAVACTDSSGPGARVTNELPALMMSTPLYQSASAAAAVSGNIVYVSLPPGSVAGGASVTIHDAITGATVLTRVVDGGFDPVGISANEGDTVSVTITRIGHGTPIHGFAVVSSRRPPGVVRTRPPKGKSDVPLNAVILVVFSAPIDASSLVPGSLQLWLGASPVPGTIRIADPAGLDVEFAPDSLLAPTSGYEVRVTTAVRDVNGLPLDSSVTVPFTTGADTSSAAPGFVVVSAGAHHSCAVVASGNAYCWGENGSGQLGDGTNTSSPVPVLVAGGHQFAGIWAGGGHSCAFTAHGDGYCWGNNDHGQLGDGTTTSRNTPVAVAGGILFYVIQAGGAHSCGSTPNGDVDSYDMYCWGANSFGQLGDNSGLDRLSPRRVPGTVLGYHIMVGGDHSCNLDNWAIGLMYCWGRNDHGQLDVGDTIDRPAPALLNYLPCGPPGAGCPFAQWTAGGSHSCAQAGGLLYGTHTLYCWGANESGQLGDGGTSDRGFPTVVAGLIDWGTTPGMSAGGHHTCAVTTDNVGYCWGLNSDGQLGDGTTANHSAPAVVTGASLQLTAVSAGERHSCGISIHTELYCWGSNAFGQLGNGTTAGSSVPVKVAGQP